MIAIEGRIIEGLDEFMLRLGHLTILCGITQIAGGTSRSAERAMTAFLSDLVAVPNDQLPYLAEYLKQKRLCMMPDSRADEDSPRYEKILVQSDNRITSLDGKEIQVWRQDFFFADSALRSKVGALALGKRKGSSKSGVSHIHDWLVLLELASSSGRLNASGQYLASFYNAERNAYTLGKERLLFAYILLLSDFDVIVRLVKALATSESTILAKRDALEVFRGAIRVLTQDADACGSLPQQRRARSLATEIGAFETLGSREEQSTRSTAWHRASSRFESLIDLQILVKPEDQGQKAEYQYSYQIGDPVRYMAQSFNEFASAELWIEDRLSAMIFPNQPKAEVVTEDYLREIVPAIAKQMRRPLSLVPIGLLSVAISLNAAERGAAVSISDARQSLIELAQGRPSVARVSRGSYGIRPEIISFIAKEWMRGV